MLDLEYAETLAEAVPMSIEVATAAGVRADPNPIKAPGSFIRPILRPERACADDAPIFVGEQEPDGVGVMLGL